jgi:hypothetical protein
MSCPESGCIVLEFIRGPELEQETANEIDTVDSYRTYTLNHILTQAQVVFRMHIVQRP